MNYGILSQAFQEKGKESNFVYFYIFNLYTTYIANHGFVMNYKLIELVKR